MCATRICKGLLIRPHGTRDILRIHGKLAGMPQVALVLHPARDHTRSRILRLKQELQQRIWCLCDRSCIHNKKIGAARTACGDIFQSCVVFLARAAHDSCRPVPFERAIILRRSALNDPARCNDHLIFRFACAQLHGFQRAPQRIRIPVTSDDHGDPRLPLQGIPYRKPVVHISQCGDTASAKPQQRCLHRMHGTRSRRRPACKQYMRDMYRLCGVQHRSKRQSKLLVRIHALWRAAERQQQCL